MITEGALPMGAEGRFAQRDQGIGFTSDWQLRAARQPYASLDGPGEIYLDTIPSAEVLEISNSRNRFE